MNTSDLIQSRHLARRAKIYIRQSSPHQVITNLESQRMQYALRDRAIALGWHESEIDVIDSDLGRSGATLEGRDGFKQLVADIALGEAGILLAFDATRLARNCSNWYQLLDLCGRTDCLIGDRDGIYDPTSINGRLLLGLKGQISELELHTIRARLTAGIFSKAQRGELELTLPTGLVRLDSGIVMKHPSLEVQQRIDLIFATLLERKSISQTVRWLIENDLPLPRRDRCGDIQWKRATTASVSSIVKNPAYAGAAVYGRTRWKKSENTGKMCGINLSQDQWRYCVRDNFRRTFHGNSLKRFKPCCMTTTANTLAIRRVAFLAMVRRCCTACSTVVSVATKCAFNIKAALSTSATNENCKREAPPANAFPLTRLMIAWSIGSSAY